MKKLGNERRGILEAETHTLLLVVLSPIEANETTRILLAHSVRHRHDKKAVYVL